MINGQNTAIMVFMKKDDMQSLKLSIKRATASAVAL